MEPQRVAVITMVRDEADMLPRWLAYYGDQVGLENLVVLDDGTVDGSTDDLPCTVFRIPPEPWKRDWAQTRARLANGFAETLLAVYDTVVFTDVDEFLVPDPATYDGLRDYLDRNAHRDVVAPLAVNVLNAAGVEAPLDPRRPVLAQRRFVKVAPGMCKPLVKRIPVPWLEGFHGVAGDRFDIDPDLLMVHLKYYDETVLREVAAKRHQANETEGRGGAGSAWSVEADELVGLLRSWVAEAGSDVPVLEPAQVDVSDFVTAVPRGFRARGRQLVAMQRRPLRRLPDRYVAAL